MLSRMRTDFELASEIGIYFRTVNFRSEERDAESRCVLQIEIKRAFLFDRAKTRRKLSIYFDDMESI